MPTRRSTRSSARGAGPGPATASQRGKGRARKSARLAVLIKPEVVEEEKEEPTPIPETKPVKNSNNKETSNKSKSSADDFEDITSGNEFEAIDSDPDDVQIITSVANKSKNNNTILEDISDCSINDNEPELEDISSEGSDNEDLAISCGSKIKKTKGIKKETLKTTEKGSSREMQDSDESDKEIVKKAEDLTDDEKVALGKVKDEKLDEEIKAVDDVKLVETLAKVDEESSDSVKIIESNVTEIDDSKDLHEDISDEEHDDIYDDFVDDDENAKPDANDEKKQVDDVNEQADDEKEQADDEKDEDDDEKEQADDDNEDDGKLEIEEQFDEELEDGDGKLEVEDDEDQDDGDEVQDDEQEDEKENLIDDDKKIEVASDDKETKLEDKQNGDENLEVEDDDDENCENEEEVDDEEGEEEGDEPEDSSKDDELKLETEDDEMKTDVKSSEDDKIKEGNLDDDEDMEEFDEDGDYVEEDDEELVTNDIEEEMETGDKDKRMETAESEDKVVEETDDDKAKEDTEKEDKVVEKSNIEDKMQENADKNEKSAEDKEAMEEKILATDDKLEGDDEEEWYEEEWDKEEWDEEIQEDENEAVNKDDKKIAYTTIDDKEEKTVEKIKKTEDKEVDDKIKEAEDKTEKVDEIEDKDVKSEQNVKKIGDKLEETDDKVKKSIEEDIKIDKITEKDDEGTTASSNVDTTKSASKIPAADDSSSNKIESIKEEIPQVEKIESDVKKDETKESKLKLKPKLPAKKPPAPKNKPLMKENVAPAKTESCDTKSDDKTKLKTESVTKPTSEKSEAKAASNDKNTSGLKSKRYTIPKISSRKESAAEKSDESKKTPPLRRKVVKTPEPVIEFKKEDLEIAAKNNIILKAVTVKVKRLPSVDKNGVSIKNIEDYTTPKSSDEPKDLEQIDLSDGWKIMDEAVGDPANEKKAKEAEAKRPFYKKPYIRGIEKFRPAVIDLLKTIKGTIVGLDYMVEVWKEDGRSPPRYYCGACKTLKVIENLEDHLTSLTHKLEIMRVTSLDCWHRFPAAPLASWPEGYVNLLEELSKSLIQQPLDDKHVILVTSLHWYNLRRREIDERVRRVHHPSISSKMYIPLFEKLPKVENLGEARKKRIASMTDKNKEKTSPASSGTKKFESSSSKSSSGADRSGSKPNISKTTNTKKDDVKTTRTPAIGSKGSSPGKKCVEKSSTVKKDSKNVDTKKVPIKNESSNQSKDKKPSVGGVGSGQVRGVKTSLSGGNDKSESATKSRRLSSPKRRRSPSPKSHKSDNKSPRRRSPIRRSSPRRSPINTRRSPLRRSSPVRRSSPQRRISPFQRRISPFRKMSPLRRSPLRSRLSPRRSPLRSRLSPRRSPLRRLTPRKSPLRSRLSPRRSPLRRLSPRISPRRSPLRRSSPRRSPFRRNSPRRSPLRRLTPRRSRSPLRRLTPRRSPIRRSSPSRRSPVRISPPRKNSGYGDGSPLRRQRSPSPRYHRGGGGGVSPKNRSRSPSYFKARSPLPYKREGNVVVVDDEIMRGPQQQQPRLQPNVPDFNQRYDLFNQNPMDARSNVNPTLNYPISTDTGELFSQRGGIFATSAKRKPIISFDEDIVTSTKRSRMDPYQPDALEMSATKMNKEKKGGNFWESWHKTHDEEAEAAAASQALQEEIWTKQRQNWPGVNPDVRGAAGYNRQLLGRDSISVTVFNKSEKPDILISKNDVGYGDANPSKPTAEEIWRQQVELASSGRPNALSELRRNPNDWIQTPIGTKDKQSYQPSISELMSKKEAYDSSQSSRNIGNLGNFGRQNPASSLLGDPDIGNWSNPGNPRDSSYEGRLGSAPRHATDSWLNSDRVGASPSALLSSSSRDVNPGGSSSSSSRYGMVKTGTSSSVHPLAAAAFSGSGGLEITGGSAISTTGRRGERNSQQWNAPIRSGADTSSNISSRVSGVNIQTKSLPQDSWRGNVGNNIMTASSGTGGLMSTPQQSWRAQQQQDVAAASILSKPPQEDLNVVAQKLNSTLTRILNDYKPTGGLFSNPALKMAQQRPDQGMFRPGPVGDKLSLAQNIALALTNMGMANVPQHELVAILQHLGLLGGGGQGMMPSGNRVMDDLRETVSRFERTFQYHRF